MNRQVTRLLLSLPLLCGSSLTAIAEPQISNERAAELRKYIEGQRTAIIGRLQTQIDGLRGLQVPGQQKVALRKEWTRSIEDCKSPNFIPNLNLESPKAIGWVVLNGESAESVYGRVAQIIDQDEFMMSLHRKDTAIPAGRYSPSGLGRSVQDALLNPTEVDLGIVWVTGPSTAKITKGKSVVLKGVFVADGNKSYSTITGLRNTVPLIHQITDINKIIVAKPDFAGTKGEKIMGDKKPLAASDKQAKTAPTNDLGSTKSTVIFSDDFESESRRSQKYIVNYSGFTNWDVAGSGVDLVGPNGGYPARIDSQMVDLDGKSGSQLITKKTFELLPGAYTLTFDLHGPVGGKNEDTVVVDLGNVFAESISLKKGDPVVTIERAIVVKSPTKGKLSFKDLGADSNGALLDNVKITFAPVP